MTKVTTADVLRFADIDDDDTALVGGKGASLGALSRIGGVRVPNGFCVTTHAFARVLSSSRAFTDALAHLSRANVDDASAIRAVSAMVREVVARVAIPADLASSIADEVAALAGSVDAGDRTRFAVRSSATAEDLPTASFAGQHDTSLDVVGVASILDELRRCWASLFSERAVTYRARNAFDHAKVAMAVVVQRMVDARVSGVAFTADPISGNRKVASVEAVAGLGEALVAGRANADLFKVRDGVVVEKKLASVDGRATLTDARAAQLVSIARTIEAHFGRPQDIEWCFADDAFHIVQSRAITTLFPIPAASDDENRVYLSVGHQQMMTDAMKPLGLSVWKMAAMRPMDDAGGRLFVDITRQLAMPSSRAALVGMAAKSDALMHDALETIVKRNFVKPLPDPPPPATTTTTAAPAKRDVDPATVPTLIARAEDSIAKLKRDIEGRTGIALLDFIRDDFQGLKRVLGDPESFPAIMASHDATWWLNENLERWLGEKGVADAVSQSAPNNVTSEMGLALLDVADAIRPHREVVAYLERIDRRELHVDDGDALLDAIAKLDGGKQARAALAAYLEKFGARCVGEIDITRPRFRERPATLVPLLLANIASYAAGEAKRRFERGERDAATKRDELLARLRALPDDGAQKADDTARNIAKLRAFAGYREFPKYAMIVRFFVYKRTLLAECARLVSAGVLHDVEDAFLLTFDELHGVVRNQRVDNALIAARKDAFALFRSLTAPRVLTSEGECINGNYRRTDVDDGALVGLAVSAGVVEGRARVVHDIADADFADGDILVTAFTDPSWTPAFIAIKALVTEVGGLMTHGAVIAREYGLPAVVGVENATKHIRDGQRIRVDGTNGFVTIIS